MDRYKNSNIYVMLSMFVPMSIDTQLFRDSLYKKNTELATSNTAL